MVPRTPMTRAGHARLQQELEQLIQRLMGDFLHKALGIVGLKPPGQIP